MKISVEFDSMEEFEAFRISGKKTRGKKEEAEVEEPPSAAVVAATVATMPSQPQFVAPPQPSHGFPGANGPTPPQQQQLHPIAVQILQKIDGSLASGQTPDAIVAWFRQQLGPEAANATFDQLKQVLIPRIPEAQLRQIAPQLGITG
jgi:hypothetical protein